MLDVHLTNKALRINLEAILEVLEEDDDFERDLSDSLTWSVLFNQII